MIENRCDTILIKMHALISPENKKNREQVGRIKPYGFSITENNLVLYLQKYSLIFFMLLNPHKTVVIISLLGHL